MQVDGDTMPRIVHQEPPVPLEFHIPRVEQKIRRRSDEPRVVPIRGKAYNYLQAEKVNKKKKRKQRSRSLDKYDKEYNPEDDYYNKGTIKFTAGLLMNLIRYSAD